MATDYEGMVPRGISLEFLEAIEREALVLELGNTMRMSDATVSLPVVSFMPQAGFTASRYGGRKPATKIEWTAEELVPEEIAATLAIPENWIRDAGFDVWANVRPTLITALSRVLDAAVLFGAGAPANYPAGGLAAVAGAALVGDDAFDALDQGLEAVETSGLVPNGIGSSLKINSALRREYRAIGAVPSTVPQLSYAGIPISTTPEWDDSVGDAIVGDYTKLAIGIREDISFRTSDSAILQDQAGAIIANTFQDNLVALKVWMKVGVAIGVPVLPDNSGPAKPFAAVDWTPAAP